MQKKKDIDFQADHLCFEWFLWDNEQIFTSNNIEMKMIYKVIYFSLNSFNYSTLLLLVYSFCIVIMN